MQHLFLNADRFQAQYMETKIALMSVLKTEAGFYEAVKSFVKTGNHPLVAYENVENRFEMLFSIRRYKTFEHFLNSIKKLGHEHPGDFYKV